jgi:hypothetical protein
MPSDILYIRVDYETVYADVRVFFDYVCNAVVTQ